MMETLIEAGRTVVELAPVASWEGDGPGPWILIAPLFWGLVILGLVLLVRGGRWFGSGGGGGRSGSAIEVLERRFAAGEIDLEQYRERRDVLERDG